MWSCEEDASSLLGSPSVASSDIFARTPFSVLPYTPVRCTPFSVLPYTPVRCTPFSVLPYTPVRCAPPLVSSPTHRYVAHISFFLCWGKTKENRRKNFYNSIFFAVGGGVRIAGIYVLQFHYHPSPCRCILVRRGKK